MVAWDDYISMNWGAAQVAVSRTFKGGALAVARHGFPSPTILAVRETL
jgi:hypothetical protein